MKVYVLLVLLISAVAAEKNFITFKNEECERTALNLHATAFGGKSKFYQNIGVLSVETSSFELLNSSLANKELMSCMRSVSQDETVHIAPLHSNAGENEKHWQQRRINVRNLPLPDDFTRFEVKDVKSHVYVIDSGIDGAHPDFQGRLAPEEEHHNLVPYDFCCDKQSALCDCAEHGTHCAGLIASPEAGYNPNTTLHSAKVFDQSGSASYDTILEAMDWVIGAHKKTHPDELAVVSMSLGGGYNDAINQAANKIVENGLFLAVAAGNANKDSCTGSPSSAEKAFTVGASAIDDSRAFFSEYGKCVDIFAPGLDIWSCKPGGSYQFLSGTSMATPFVAGFASYVGTYLRTTDPVKIQEAINAASTRGVVTDAKSDANNLPFDNLDGDKVIEHLNNVRNTLKYLLKNN